METKFSQEERLLETSFLRRLLNRPELGAAGGLVVVWAFFAIVAGKQGFLSLKGTSTYLDVAAELGIVAVPISLLMIGGEFDLSVGSIVGASGMIVTILPVKFGWNIWAAMAVALLVALAIGFANGYLVVKTGLSSFIITLGTLYIVRGATIGLTRVATGRTQLGGLAKVHGYHLGKLIFASDVMVKGTRFPISILWWIVVTAAATWLLNRTQFGNWIFGVGGDATASRMVGVPVHRVKITLFMLTAGSAWLLSVIQAISFTGSDVLRGTGLEFFAIIAAVIGGTLLTGGYGSAAGTVLGALIFGMVRQGIVFAGVDADWFQVFLGVMLVVAVLVNNYVREKAAEMKR